MKIKHCNAIIVEKNGSREIFHEGDIVCVEYWDKKPACLKPKNLSKCLKVTGRIRRFYNGVVWRDWANVVYGGNLILDVSTEYHGNKIEINLDNIKSIKRIPD